MPLESTVVSDKLQAYLLTGVFGEVEPHIRPGPPAHSAKGVKTRNIRTGMHIILRTGRDGLSVGIKHTHHETGLSTGEMSRIL